MGSVINQSLHGFLIGAVSMLGLALSSASCKAQSYNEIFRQKKTQEEYLLKQIAYLKLYAEQARKGYKLVSGGLKTINDFSSGEFSLHEAFLSALSGVSALVRNDFRVAEIIRFQTNIRSGFRVLVKSTVLARDQNRKYFRDVEEGVLRKCDADMDELLDIVLSGGAEMNDAQRLSRLEKIHEAMADKAAFVRWFCAEARHLSAIRNNELIDLKKLRRLYEKN